MSGEPRRNAKWAEARDLALYRLRKAAELQMDVEEVVVKEGPDWEQGWIGHLLFSGLVVTALPCQESGSDGLAWTTRTWEYVESPDASMAPSRFGTSDDLAAAAEAIAARLRYADDVGGTEGLM